MTAIEALTHPAQLQSRPSLRALATWTLGATDQHFETLPGPRPGELQGLLRGGILAAPGVSRLPLGLRRLLYGTFLRSTLIWLGKSFDGDRGANTWWTPRGHRPWLRYSLHAKPAADGTDAIALDYDIDANPTAARRAAAEIRRHAPGEFIGKMTWRTGDNTRRVLYFFLRA